MSQDWTQGYLERYKAILRLAEQEMEPGLSPEEMTERVREASRTIRGLMQENSVLLEERLYPALRGPESMSREQAEELFRFTQDLSSYFVKEDSALSAEVLSAVADYARSAGDIPLLLRALHFRVIALFNCDSTKLLMEERLKSLRELVGYTEHGVYEKLDSESRSYAARARGNIAATLSLRRPEGFEEFYKASRNCLDFYNDPAVRARDPQLPWEQYRYTVNQNMANWLDVTRLPPRDARVVRMVREAAAYLSAHNDDFAGKTAQPMRARWLYVEIAAKYCAGELSGRSLIGGLMELYRGAAADDYSAEGIYRRTGIPELIFEYLPGVADLTAAEKHGLTDKILPEYRRYCMGMHKVKSKAAQRSILITSTKGLLANLPDEDTFYQVYRDLLISLHLPTYVHSRMVSRISGELLELAAARSPGLLAGLGAHLGMRNVEELKNYIQRAAFFHDVGKLRCVSSVSQYGRRLTDLEFRTIRAHPELGAGLVEKLAYLKRYGDVVRGHHKWYDGMRGYPEPFDNTASPVRAAIDIVSIADSMDAATDSVGRTYAPSLSAGDFLDELSQQAGTRYSPGLAELIRREFPDPEVLRGYLLKERIQAYYDAYRMRSSNGEP